MSDEIVNASGVPEAAKKERTPEEKERVRLAVAKHRREKKQDSSIKRPSSTQEITEKAARQILIEERGLKNARVIDVCLKLAEVAATANKLPYNRYLFSHGIQKALAARASKTATLGEPPDVEDVWIPGSRIRLHEQYALFDYGLGWQEVKDKRYTFDEFRNLRRLCITDVFRFGRDVLGRDFHELPHGRWATELFVPKNPDLLPEDYDMEDYKKAFDAQSDIKQRLLIASRSSYKSSYNLVDLLSWVLCFPSIRIMCLSSTKPLSKGFLKLFRAWWTIKNLNQMTLFNLLYPEFMTFPGEEGAETSYTSPMRRLDFAQPTYFPVSIDTEGLAGERCCLFVAEDIAEISNSSNTEQREKTQTKFDLLRELLEPYGGLQIVGTPIASGLGTVEDPGDVYSVLMKRDEDSGDHRLLYQINPCWTVKEGIRKEPYDNTLTADEVTLLFPSRLTFKFLMGKLKENVRQFRQQSLCSWVPDDSATLRCQFSEDDLRAHLRQREYFNQFPLIQSILGLDTAFSISKYADMSALVYGEVRKKGDQHIFVVVDVIADRWKQSELALQVVNAVQKHGPGRLLSERVGAWESLSENIGRVAMMRGVALPSVYFKPTTGMSSSMQSKAARVKSLEPLLANDQLWFVSNSLWNDLAFKQICLFDGITKSSQYRKDDIPDCISMCTLQVMPRTIYQAQDAERDSKAEEEERNSYMRREHYNRTFGMQYQPPPPPANPEPVRPTDPRERVFGGNGLSIFRRR